MHGVGGEDGTAQELLEILGIPFTGPGAAACARCMDKVLAKHAMREAGIPTPDWFAFNQTAFRELGAADALGRLEESLGFPLVVKPSRGGSSLGVKFAADRRRGPAGPGRRLQLRRPGRCSSASSRAASWRSACSAARRCRSSRRSRRRATATTSRPATRSAAPDFVCPAELSDQRARRRHRGRARHLPRARLLRLRPRRPDPRRRRPLGPRGQRDPRPHRHQPPPPGRRGGGDVLRAAGRADPRPGARAPPPPRDSARSDRPGRSPRA